MRIFVTSIALAALATPFVASAQIAEIDLPPSDIADPADADGQAPYADPAADSHDRSDAGDYDESYNDAGYADAGTPDDLADILDDPARQDDIADAMTGMMRALMTIRVGPILDAARKVDPRAGDAYGTVAPDTTIGDIASRGDPDYEDRIEDGIRGGTATTGTIVREFAKMMPTLIAIAKDMGAQAEQAIERERR